jgi:hypothetical protein
VDKICNPPMDISRVGWMAMRAGTQGAALVIVKSEAM